MDYEHMSERLQKVLMDAANDAQSKQHPSVDTIDLLAAIFKDDILDGLFERVGIDKNKALEIIRDEEGHIASSPSQNLNFSTTVQSSLEKAEKWASDNNYCWEFVKAHKYKIWHERDNIIKEIEFVRELLGLQ